MRSLSRRGLLAGLIGAAGLTVLACAAPATPTQAPGGFTLAELWRQAAASGGEASAATHRRPVGAMGVPAR